jgi:polyferredoxin
MLTDTEIARTFLTGCLAFLAILPSSLSITISYYRSEIRKEGQTWESVRWHRRMVWAIILTFWIIVSGYLLSLYILLNLRSILQYLLTPIGTMTVIVTCGILLLGGSFTLFTLLMFSTDYNREGSRLYTIYDKNS